MTTKLLNQLRENSVALTSLLLVVIGLAYNTWRNEQTEFNDNIRAAGFEMLVKLGELERVIFHAISNQVDTLRAVVLEELAALE